MSWLKSIFHDLFGHPVGLKHGTGCGLCAFWRTVVVCTDCGRHYTINEPAGGGFR